MDFIAVRLGCPFPSILEYTDFSVDVANANPVPGSGHEMRYPVAQFTFSGRAPILIDPFYCVQWPDQALASMARQLGTFGLMVVLEPLYGQASVLDDWTTPNSAIGAPIGDTGYYSFKYTGEPEGTIVTGPASGRQYKLIRHGVGLFSNLVWQAQ